MLTVTKLVLLLKFCDLQDATKVHHHMTDTDCALQCRGGRPPVIFIITNSNDRPWWYLYQRSYLIYHALLILSMNYFLLLHQGEWRSIDLSIYIWPWLHVGQLGCGSSDGGTAALTPVASVHTSLWCDTAAEWQAVYQPVNTAANLSQPTINTRAPG